MEKVDKKAKRTPATRTRKAAGRVPERKFRYLKKYVELVPDPWGLES